MRRFLRVHESTTFMRLANEHYKIPKKDPMTLCTKTWKVSMKSWHRCSCHGKIITAVAMAKQSLRFPWQNNHSATGLWLRPCSGNHRIGRACDYLPATRVVQDQFIDLMLPRAVQAQGLVRHSNALPGPGGGGLKHTLKGKRALSLSDNNTIMDC